MNKKILEEEIELYERMSQIEIFPGSLEEYENMKKQKYEVMDIPGNRKYLIGGIGIFTELKKRKISLLDKLDRIMLLIPIDPTKQTYYEIIRQATKLGADAIIRYQVIDGANIRYEEMGIPVRKKANM